MSASAPSAPPSPTHPNTTASAAAQAAQSLRERPALPAAFSDNYLRPQGEVLDEFRLEAGVTPASHAPIAALASNLIATVRKRDASPGMDSFLRQYSLDSEEGVLLMCLAEALLRVPDAQTAQLLVEDKLGGADWEAHVGASDSFLVNASTWGLLLTGQLLELRRAFASGFTNSMRRLIGKLGSSVALQAIRQAMALLGNQFVIRPSIEAAIRAADEHDQRRSDYSFDMLGEAALTEDDANRYLKAYAHAITAVGGSYRDKDTGSAAVSIKLSALYPRFEVNRWRDARVALCQRTQTLLDLAAAHQVQITIDAEEARRHQLLLTIFHDLLDSVQSGDKTWQGLGIAVQAYQRRALPTLRWLTEQAQRYNTVIPVRLVKGAYWDSEIKYAQEQSLADYPVFTRKPATDVSYLSCAAYMLKQSGRLYPQFASHNAYTLAAVLQLAKQQRADQFEIQRLYGMGEELFRAIGNMFPAVRQRIYAPVGQREALLPYLMRRLLENGANSSFVHHINDDAIPVAELVRHPDELLSEREHTSPGTVPLPRDLFTPRVTAVVPNLDDERVLAATLDELARFAAQTLDARPLIAGMAIPGTAIPAAIYSPNDQTHLLGHVLFAGEHDATAALRVLSEQGRMWSARNAHDRAKVLDTAADLLQARMTEFAASILYEAGRPLRAAFAEVREAIDFCRHYAALAREQCGVYRSLPSPAGEENRWFLAPRGPFACVAPWNFPLSLFMGQVCAALAAGNPVLAKPSELASLTAYRAVRLLHEAGVPEEALCFVPGDGAVLANVLTDARLCGVAVTGANRTAQAIAKALAARDAPLIPLIAETGGVNCMLVDSTALPEQVVRDVLASAFDSAGQRCSALRVLFLQEDIADDVTEMLLGALALLRSGHPADISYDVGPVINARAKAQLEATIASMQSGMTLLGRGPEPDPAWRERGFYLAPHVFLSDELALPTEEAFGPILQIKRYRSEQWPAVLEAIRVSRFALTLGLHSRIEQRIAEVEHAVPVGNFYVNRTIVGATVGSQPFGGFGYSGSGHKAGGPHSLLPYCVERVTSHNTAAVGGDATLLRGSV